MEQLLSLCKCSVLAGAAVLVLTALRPVLGRRYQARWRCGLWLALALVLLLPLCPASWTAAVTEHAPIRIEVPPPEPIVIRTAPEGGPAARPPESQAPAAPPAVRGVPGEAAAPPVSAGKPETPADTALRLPALLRAVWLAGVAAFALYFVTGNLVFYRRTLRWSRPAPPALRERLAETARAMALRRTPVLLVSEDVKSPMVIGLLRPKLVLPAESCGGRELDFIFRHELTHCRRGDLWVKLLLLAANGVHWFNPLVYLLVREASMDLELACDDAVVAGADRETRKAYSETLLSSLHRQSGLTAVLSTHFYGGAKTMKERFRNILAGGRRKRGLAVLCGALLLLAAAGCAVALTEQKPVPLTAEELSEWQEKLAEPGWNGLFTHMYSVPEYINLQYVLYQGAGLGHDLTAAERTAARDAFFTNYEGKTGDVLSEAFGEPWENRIVGIYAADLEAYLREYTGLDFAALSHTRKWNYLEEYDSYYILNSSIDTLRLEVLSGERQGDTVRLTIRREQADRNKTISDQAGMDWEDGMLTVTDGRVVSYTNPLYADVEAAASAVMLRAAASENVQVAMGQPPLLYMACRGEAGDYHLWQFTLRLTGEDTGTRSESVRMITRRNGDGTVETLETAQGDPSRGEDRPDYIAMGYRFEDYVRYRYDYDLPLSIRHQGGWPAASDAFLEAFRSGGAEWAKDPEETAAQFLYACGDELVSAGTIYESGTEADGETLAYQDAVLRCTTAAGRQVLLLVNRLNPREGGSPGYWFVASCRVESGEDLPAPDNSFRSAAAQLGYTAGYREVWQERDTEWVKAGNYLVLPPDGWAFRVEDYFMENAERVRELMNGFSDRFPAPFGEIRLDGMELVRTEDSGFPREDDGLYTLFIYRADWAMHTPEGPTDYAGGTVDKDGYWRGDGTSYLVLEGSYGKGCVTRSFLMRSGYEPGSEQFARELRTIESGLSSAVQVTEHDSHPAILYDSTAGALSAVHTSPDQGGGSGR